MERRRTRSRLIFGGCILAVLVVALVLPSADDGLRPVTRERIAAEVIGDEEAAGCVFDGLTEREIDPDVLDLLLNVDADETLVDPRRRRASRCAAGPGAPGAPTPFEPELVTASGPGTAQVAIVETTIPTPVVEIASDGAAEVVWLPSTETVRIDPELPEAASNRTP